MFPLIDYRIKILIFSDINKFFFRLYSGLCPCLCYGLFSPPDRVSPHPCRALSCIIARHSPTSVRKVQTALRKVLPLSYRQREGRFRTSSPDYPENTLESTGRYPGNDRTIPRQRLVDILALTGQYLSIDWSISWHRLIDARMAGTRKSGVCKELIY